MSDIAIQVQGISKRYSIGSKSRGYQTFRDAINNVASGSMRMLRNGWESKEKEESQTTSKSAYEENERIEA